jgi:hypothetical protein
LSSLSDSKQKVKTSASEALAIINNRIPQKLTEWLLVLDADTYAVVQQRFQRGNLPYLNDEGLVQFRGASAEEMGQLRRPSTRHLLHSGSLASNIEIDDDIDNFLQDSTSGRSSPVEFEPDHVFTRQTSGSLLNSSLMGSLTAISAPVALMPNLAPAPKPIPNGLQNYTPSFGSPSLNRRRNSDTRDYMTPVVNRRLASSSSFNGGPMPPLVLTDLDVNSSLTEETLKELKEASEPPPTAKDPLSTLRSRKTRRRISTASSTLEEQDDM